MMKRVTSMNPVTYIVLLIVACMLGCDKPVADKLSDQQNRSQAHVDSANLYYQRGQLVVASREARTALELNEYLVEAYYVLAMINRDAGYYEDTAYLLEEAIEISEDVFPFQTPVIRLLIETTLKIGDEEEVTRLLSDPRIVAAVDSPVLLAICQAKLKLLQNSASEAIHLLNSMDYRSAPKPVQSRFDMTRGQAYKMINDNVASEVAYMQSIDLDPSNTEAIVALADLYQGLHRMSQAEDLLTEALYRLQNTDILTADRRRILKKLRLVLIKQGRTKEAMTYSFLMDEQED